MKTENMNYEAPQLTIIEVEVEKGFAQSVTGKGTNTGLDSYGRQSW